MKIYNIDNIDDNNIDNNNDNNDDNNKNDYYIKFNLIRYNSI